MSGGRGKFSPARSARWEGQHFMLLKLFQRVKSLPTDTRSKALTQHSRAEDFRGRSQQFEPLQILVFLPRAEQCFPNHVESPAKIPSHRAHGILKHSVSAHHNPKYTQVKLSWEFAECLWVPDKVCRVSDPMNSRMKWGVFIQTAK